jgi:hypothetical protein
MSSLRMRPLSVNHSSHPTFDPATTAATEPIATAVSTTQPSDHSPGELRGTTCRTLPRVEAQMIVRDGLPPTPDWHTEAREAPEFTRTEVKQPCQLCKQQLDGRGDQ